MWHVPPKSRVHSPSSGGRDAPGGGCDDVDRAHSCPESKSHTVSSELLGWERWPGGPRRSHWGHLSVQAKSPVSVQLLNCVQLFATWNLLKLTSIESMMPSNHLILCHPLLLLLAIFPSISHQVISQFFASGGQRIGAPASASVLPMNIQD